MDYVKILWIYIIGTSLAVLGIIVLVLFNNDAIMTYLGFGLGVGGVVVAGIGGIHGRKMRHEEIMGIEQQPEELERVVPRIKDTIKPEEFIKPEKVKKKKKGKKQEIPDDFDADIKPIKKGKGGMRKCAGCGTKNRIGAIYCSNCGDKLSRFCPKCKRGTSEGAKFCDNCGFKIG